jgi:hypothetical protein
MADIFDKIAGGINRGVTLVGANSKALVEKAKINSAIKNLKDEKKQLTELLGMKIYEIYTSGKEIANEDIAGIAGEITKRIELATAQEEKLKQLDVELSTAGRSKEYSPVCECGKINPAGSKFCSICGKPL